MTSAENAKIAIYWDFENIHACLIDREYGREEYINNRYRPQPPIVQIEPVIDYAASLGDVVIHKAYCNWQFFGRYQESLNSSGMDLIQIFPRGWNAKNGADISLALDALTDAQQHSHITHVLIISNDTDFVSLAQKVNSLAERSLVSACQKQIVSGNRAATSSNNTTPCASWLVSPQSLMAFLDRR